MSDTQRPEQQPPDQQLVVVTETTSAVQAAGMGMLQFATPDAMLQSAAAIATPLKKFIDTQGLVVVIGQSRHVKIEGWLTMINMLGVFPQEISVEEQPVPVAGWGPKFIVKMALVRVSDQQVVCSASAECGGVDERDWHWQPKYKWVPNPNDTSQNPRKYKVPDGEEPVPGNQRRSMAITRATAKAARIGFAWIMTTAGYSPTPAEELSASDIESAKVRPDDQAPPAAGRDPREMTKDRGQYSPGATNAPRQESAKPAAASGRREDAARQMASKFRFDCMVCGDEGKAGEQMAYLKDYQGTYVAHWSCHTREKGGGR